MIKQVIKKLLNKKSVLGLEPPTSRLLKQNITNMAIEAHNCVFIILCNDSKINILE